MELTHSDIYDFSILLKMLHLLYKQGIFLLHTLPLVEPHFVFNVNLH